MDPGSELPAARGPGGGTRRGPRLSAAGRGLGAEPVGCGLGRPGRRRPRPPRRGLPRRRRRPSCRPCDSGGVGR
eukprot:7016861-Alexandrium_andersonii.AAC.1